MGCTSLAGMSHCSSWSAPTCAGTDLVLLQWTLEAHRASSFISNCLMSLPQKNTSSALLCLNMIILSGFMWWLSHRTAVVPKLVVLRAPFTTEILELYISGFFRQMPWFQPGLIFVVVRKGQGQDTVILCHLTWLLGAGESGKATLFQGEGVQSGGGSHPVLSAIICWFYTWIIYFLILSVIGTVAI